MKGGTNTKNYGLGKDVLLKLLSSKIIHFVSTRYVGYGIQFLNTLILAKYLNVHFLGVYGFITLMLQYLSYANLGTQYSLNYYLSVKGVTKSNQTVYSNTLSLNLIIGGVILLAFCFISFFDLDIYQKYNLNKYYVLIGLICLFQILNQMYVNIYRTYGLLWQINLFQLIIPLLQFFGFIFFREEVLLFYILVMNVVGNLISLIIFFLYNPIKAKPSFKIKVSNILLSKGINLLIYNISFYLIMLSGRTIVGIFYTVEEMGQYSFGSNLSNAVMMVMGSVSFLFFSKIINRLSQLKSKNETQTFIENSRKLYFNLTLVVGLFFFISIPLLEYFLKYYSLAFQIFQALLISQIILANSFGYTTLLIAKNKEMSLAKVALVTVIINLVLSSTVVLLNFKPICIAFSTMLSVVFYNFYSVKLGLEFIDEKTYSVVVFKYLFPVSLIIVLSFMILSTMFDNVILGLIAFIYYLIIKRNELLDVFNSGLKIINNKDSLGL